MPYQASVTSNITANTTSAEGISLDHSIFVDAQTYFKERTRSYGSWTEIQEDLSIPTGSASREAARIAFSQDPAPSRFYLGRREVDLTLVTPESSVLGTVYSFNVAVYTSTGVLNSSDLITFIATDTNIATITAAWQVLLAGISDITSVVSTGDQSVEFSADTGFIVEVTGFTNCVSSFTSTETPAEILAAIQDEDNDWYCMMGADHTEAYQLAMAAEIEATGSTDKPKIHWTSTASADTIKAVVDPADDVIGKLQALGYNRTVCDWHDQADTLFPESGSFNYNSTYQAGSTTYKFMQVIGVPAASTVTGLKTTLPTRLQGFIDDRNGGWMGIERNVNFYHGGKVVGGSDNWIDNIIGTDWLNDRIEVEVLNVFLNAKGGKIAYSSPAKILTTIDSVLQEAVNNNFLESFIPATAPDYLTEIPFSDKVSRILKDIDWTGYLSGAVHFAIINGNLTYQSAELT